MWCDALRRAGWSGGPAAGSSGWVSKIGVRHCTLLLVESVDGLLLLLLSCGLEGLLSVWRGEEDEDEDVKSEGRADSR